MGKFLSTLAACLAAVGQLWAQAPNISYPAGSYTFPAGQAIPSIVPTNTGGSPTGATVSTVAGTGSAGFADGVSAAAMFSSPTGIVADGTGNLFIADQYNHRIRKITPGGMVSTLAGSGTAGFADGSGTAASFSSPTGLAIDGNGNIYVADAGNHRIRKISTSGTVTTIAGNGTAGNTDGTGTAATFVSPSGIAVDAAGMLYVTNSNSVRKVTSSGVVTTIAGSSTGSYADGTGTAAGFSNPRGIAVDGNGNIYVTQLAN